MCRQDSYSYHQQFVTFTILYMYSCISNAAVAVTSTVAWPANFLSYLPTHWRSGIFYTLFMLICFIALILLWKCKIVVLWTNQLMLKNTYVSVRVAACYMRHCMTGCWCACCIVCDRNVCICLGNIIVCYVNVINSFVWVNCRVVFFITNNVFCSYLPISRHITFITR